METRWRDAGWWRETCGRDEQDRGTNCSRQGLAGWSPRVMLHLGRCSCNASVWSPKRWREQGVAEVQLALLDVKKVHLNARCDEEWCFELADECEERGTYAKLSRWLYLVRKAAWAWEDDNARKLTLHRSRRCRTAPATFFHPETQVTVVGHGDYFTCAGTESGLSKIRPKLCEWYDVKRRGILGSGAAH